MMFPFKNIWATNLIYHLSFPSYILSIVKKNVSYIMYFFNKFLENIPCEQNSDDMEHEKPQKIVVVILVMTKKIGWFEM